MISRWDRGLLAVAEAADTHSRSALVGSSCGGMPCDVTVAVASSTPGGMRWRDPAPRPRPGPCARPFVSHEPRPLHPKLPTRGHAARKSNGGCVIVESQTSQVAFRSPRNDRPSISHTGRPDWLARPENRGGNPVSIRWVIALVLHPPCLLPSIAIKNGMTTIDEKPNSWFWSLDMG